jgi:cell division protein FtsN
MNRKQFGGVWLGVLLGLLLGLMLAVGFAYFITKNSSKVFKNNDQTASQYENRYNKDTPDVASAAGATNAKNQNVKRTAAVLNPVAKASTPQDVTKPPTTNQKPEKEGIKEDKTKTNQEDSKGQTSGSATSDTEKIETTVALFLQLGAFKSQEDAEKLQARLKQAGINEVGQITQSSKDKLFRLKIGPFKDKTERNQTKERLALVGFESVPAQ